MKEFTKLDTDKPMVSLVEPNFILGMAEILTFGARKYSNYGIIPEDKTIGRISQAWNANTVTKVTRYTLNREQTSVEPVTTNNVQMDLSVNTATRENKYTSKVLWSAETVTTSDLNERIQSTQTGNEKMPENGLQPTQNGSPRLKSMNENGIKTQKGNVNTKKEGGLIHYPDMGLHKVIMIVNLKKGAAYVDKTPSNTLISTTATILESSEEYFVVGATTDSECLETIYLVLEELSLISKPLKKIITKSGIDNWKYATKDDIRRIKDSLLRHVLAYTSGDLLDQETHLSHSYHIGCNAMFLNYLLENNSNLSKELEE